MQTRLWNLWNMGYDELRSRGNSTDWFLIKLPFRHVDNNLFFYNKYIHMYLYILHSKLYTFCFVFLILYFLFFRYLIKTFSFLLTQVPLFLRKTTKKNTSISSEIWSILDSSRESPRSVSLPVSLYVRILSRKKYSPSRKQSESDTAARTAAHNES